LARFTGCAVNGFVLAALESLSRSVARHPDGDMTGILAIRRARWHTLLVVVLLALASPSAWAACGDAGVISECVVPGWDDRPALLYVPTTLARGSAAPAVLLLHGGSGNAATGIDLTCTGGDRTQPSCLHRIAERRGFVLVSPNGTRLNPPAANRAWNAGGGGTRAAGGSWQCVGGAVCQAGVDDLAYVRALLAALPGWTGMPVSALYAMGLSNGGALAHRLACTLGPPLVGIAAVGAGNQYATSQPCQPPAPVAVLAIHGTGDRCWRFAESDRTCVISQPVGFKVGARESAEAWAVRNGCAAQPQVEAEPDADGAGLRTVGIRWSACAAPVALYSLEGAPPRAASDGAGHTYPDGQQYLPASDIGPTLRDWTMERAWDFLAAVPLARVYADGFEPSAAR
jgi:polyhydroxybutyrate depolymerase